MTASITIEGAKQTVAFNHLPHTPETALRAFFIDEEHRVMLIRGVIHGHNQVPVLSRYPFMRGAILMHHHTRQQAAFPAFAVGSAF